MEAVGPESTAVFKRPDRPVDICRIMIFQRHIRNKTSSANGLRISSKTRSLYSWPRRASCAKAFFGIPQIFAAKETARPSGLKHVKSLRSGMPRTLPSRATVVHGGTNCFLSHWAIGCLVACLTIDSDWRAVGCARALVYVACYVMLEFGQEVKNPWLPALANENKTARRWKMWKSTLSSIAILVILLREWCVVFSISECGGWGFLTQQVQQALSSACKCCSFSSNWKHVLESSRWKPDYIQRNCTLELMNLCLALFMHHWRREGAGRQVSNDLYG